MKFVTCILFLTFCVHLDFVGAMHVVGVPGGWVTVNTDEQIYIPKRSEFFLQHPRDYVVKGMIEETPYFRGVPRWVNFKNSLQNVNSNEPVFIVEPLMYGVFSKAKIETFVHNKNDRSVAGYKCFIKAEDGNTFYEANLVRRIPLDDVITRPVRTTIYVQVPGSNLIYAGELKHLAMQNAPMWIRE